jgi:signal transduction histidine kinase
MIRPSDVRPTAPAGQVGSGHAAAIHAAAVVERVSSPALVLDPHGRITAANAAMAQCLACSVERLVGTELVACAADPAALHDFLRAGGGSPGEFRFRTGDGGERRLEISIGKCADANVVSAFDVTADCAAQKRLQENLQRFRDMAGAGSVEFFEMDPTLTRMRLFRDGKMAEGNVHWPGDVIDVTYDPKGLAGVRKRFAVREPVRDHIYRTSRDKGGKARYYSASSLPFYDKHGVYQGRRGISVDVTVQVVAEQALRESQARLRRSEHHFDQAQRIANTGSVKRDLKTGVPEWSAELYRILGISRDSVRPCWENYLASVHPEDRENLVAARNAASTRQPGMGLASAEFRFVRPNGEVRRIHSEWDALFDETGKPTHRITVVQDVTGLRAAEARHKDLELQLLHSQKLEALGTLAGGVAHELNNTLVPVLALAKLTAKRLPEGSRERSNLDTVLRASEKARDLVGQILAFSREEAPKLIRVDLAELARDALKLLRANLSENVTIQERIAAVPPMLGDPGQLHQIIINLVANAVHSANRETGLITVEVAPAVGGHVLQEPQRAPGQAIRLTVSDTGCGMDKATAARIFEPFFTTKPVGEGTGLGLSMVHGIVAQHGGRIAMESEPSKGTRFDVYLPALVGEEMPPSAGLATPHTQ